jgi:hypothetical protein
MLGIWGLYRLGFVIKRTLNQRVPTPIFEWTPDVLMNSWVERTELPKQLTPKKLPRFRRGHSSDEGAGDDIECRNMRIDRT